MYSSRAMNSISRNIIPRWHKDCNIRQNLLNINTLFIQLYLLLKMKNLLTTHIFRQLTCRFQYKKKNKCWYRSHRQALRYSTPVRRLNFSFPTEYDNLSCWNTRVTWSTCCGKMNLFLINLLNYSSPLILSFILVF